MRPLVLDLEGFGAFTHATTVDFTDTEFFALVGPTGAGKSTVIDGICFALYGSIPRLADRKRTADVMSLGAVETRVRLTFEISGRRFVAARVVRRSARGSVNTVEARLESLDDGTVFAGRESEFGAAIEALLGLGFDDFTRCVVLPQGAFARFLHDKPAERRDLLVRLMELGVYNRVMRAANSREADLARTLSKVDGALGELVESTEEVRAGLADRIAGSEALAAEVRERQAAYAMEHAADVELSGTIADAESRVAALGAVCVPQRVADETGELDRRTTTVEESAFELERLGGVLDALQAERSPLGEPHELRSMIELHERAAALSKLRIEREVAAESAGQRVDARRADLEQSETAAQHALHELEALRTRHRAYHVASELVPGEPCPVCEQPVDRLPFPVAPPGLEAAVERETAQRRRRVAVGEALADAERAAHTARDRVDTVAAELDELVARQADLAPLAALVRSLEQIAELDQRIAEATAEERRVRAADRSARQQLDEARSRDAQVLSEYQRQRDPLAALGAPMLRANDILGSWIELADWSKTRAELELSMLDSARAELADRRERRSAAVRALSDRAAALSTTDVRSGRNVGDPAVALSSLASLLDRETSTSRRDLERLERDASRRQELLDQRAEFDAERHVARELAIHLKTDRFQQWLIEETLRTLAERAASTLRRLSHGQFSLRLGPSGDFEIVDHTAADEARSVRTLSGGETFQASLALALALSEHLVEISGRAAGALDAIFLDEGFGTLDSESLDVVASTIESLGADGRMVGIVTHVKELADRVPVRYVVSKDARSAHVRREVAG